MSPYILAVFLYLVCAVCLVAEVFLPSGGLLAIMATASLVWGIVLFFQQGVMAGWIGLGTAGILVPSTLVLAYKLLPKTRFGKAVTLNPPQRPGGDAIPDLEGLRALVGRTGQVLTPLRPVGTCDFSGQRIECVAESGYVEAGSWVEVMRVDNAQLTVRVTRTPSEKG